MTPLQHIDRCADYLKERLPALPACAVTLGSGLGGLVDRFSDTTVIPYGDIPGFPKPTVAGHRGEMVFGKLAGRWILGMAGRFHYYEGHDPNVIVFPTRVLARMGVRSILITNAAGGVSLDFQAGDVMLITDHLNLTGQNPLRGDNIDDLGTRFPDMSHVYDLDYQELARRVAQEKNLSLKEGVYAWMTGPCYETPAEVRWLRTIGGDAAGMSTVPEAIAARHAGMRVAGLSLITNMAAGVLDQPLTHTEVTATANEAAPRFQAIVEGILAKM